MRSLKLARLIHYKRPYLAKLVALLVALAIIGIASAATRAYSLNTYSGTLRDNSGNIVAGVQIELIPDGQPVADAVATTTTGSDGSFSLNAPPAKYMLFVAIQGSPISHINYLELEQSSADIDLSSGNIAQDLTLPTATIHVTVKDANGNVVPGATVTANSYSNSQTPTVSLYPGDGGEKPLQINSSTTTATDGTADLGSLAGITYGTKSQTGICAVIDGNNICKDSPTTVDGNTDITIQAPATNTFSGILKDSSGQAISGLQLRLVPAGQSIVNAVAITTTGPDGSFSLSAIPASYVLFIQTQGSSIDQISLLELEQATADIDLTAGNIVKNLTLPTSTIHVTVKDGNGNVVPGATVTANSYSNSQTPTVSLYPGDGGERPLEIKSSSTTTTDGTADLGSLAGITYGTQPQTGICAVIAGNNICNTISITVNGDISVIIQAPASNTFSGILRDSSGNTVPGVQLKLVPDGQSVANAVATTTTASDGSFSLSATPAKYMLFVEIQGSPIELINYLELEQSGADIDLSGGNMAQDLTLPTATIHVTVKDANGNVVPDAAVTADSYDNTTTPTVSLYSGDSGEVPLQIKTSATTGASGTADLGSLVGITYSGLVQTGICADISGTEVCNNTPVTINNTDTTVSITIQPAPTTPTNLAAVSPTQNPTLTWTTVSGATSYNIYRNGTKIDSSTSASYTDNNAPEGTYTYYVTAVSAGGESSPSNSIDVLVNRTPPTTAVSLSPSPYADGDYSNPVTVALEATAARAGISIANTYYTIDGGSQQTYSTPFTVSGAGDHTITYWSVDNSGVQESPNSKAFTIHQSPAINPLSDATINEGDTFSQNGSFTSGAASWTATVDYSDGAGSQPLSLSGKDFSLSHTYKDNGTYTVTIKVTDNDGASDTSTVTVIVHNVAPSVGDITASVNPIQVNTSTTASANFTDPGVLDTHTASWDWGDGSTSNGTVTENNGSGTVSDSHTYTTTGVYTIKLTVTDKDGDSTTQIFQYLSVYNPTPTGLFSGARIFSSPTGAYAENPLLTGQVQFGVTSKYDHNDQPTGNVSMKFKAADLDFASTGVTVLVTSNGTATLRGTGTINGSGNYTFLVTGLDSQQNGGQGEIRFQIKDSSGNIVYDSQPGAADTVTPSTQVTGQVIVH